VPEVAHLVAERTPATLVLAAGGITDGRGLAAALSLGADGVVVGTRLLASREAPVDDEAKSRVIASTSDDTVRTTVLDIVCGRDWAAPYDGRLLRNDFLNRWHGHEEELRSNRADDTFRAEGAAEDLNGANMFVGEAVGVIHDVLPAAAILRRMVLEAANTMRHGSAASDFLAPRPSNRAAVNEVKLQRNVRNS
jgi:nitronate monooxygenase